VLPDIGTQPSGVPGTGGGVLGGVFLRVLILVATWAAAAVVDMEVGLAVLFLQAVAVVAMSN